MKKLLNYMPIVSATPPIILGAITMYHNDVPGMIWAQNIICLIIAGAISCLVISRKANVKSRFSKVITAVMLILLIMTLFGEGMENVNRWIKIGPVNFNVAFVATPCVLIGLWELLKNKFWNIAAVLTVAISTIFYLQPDASQISAFAIPMIIMLYDDNKKKTTYLVTVAVLLFLVAMSWIHIDGLLPVSYVEEILVLSKNMGTIWFVLGVISLIMLPIPFILFSPEKAKKLSICIGIYIVILLASTLIGNFPVPLMGYGMPPIIGYFISMTWYSKSKMMN